MEDALSRYQQYHHPSKHQTMRLNNSKFYMLDNHFRQIVKAQFKFKFDHSKGVTFWVFFWKWGSKVGPNVQQFKLRNQIDFLAQQSMQDKVYDQLTDKTKLTTNRGIRIFFFLVNEDQRYSKGIFKVVLSRKIEILNQVPRPQQISTWLHPVPFVLPSQTPKWTAITWVRCEIKLT